MGNLQSHKGLPGARYPAQQNEAARLRCMSITNRGHAFLNRSRGDRIDSFDVRQRVFSKVTPRSLNERERWLICQGQDEFGDGNGSSFIRSVKTTNYVE